MGKQRYQMVKDFDPKKISKVKIDDVRPNTWNPKEKDTKEYEKVKQSILVNGLRGAIVVRENDGYEIIDGEQRFTSAKELGYEEVYIYNEGKVPDPEAKALTIWWQQQVPLDHIKEAYMINDLVIQMPTIELPYSDIELSDLKELANFDFDQYNTERPEEEDGVKTLSIKMASDKYAIIMSAIDYVKKANDVDEAYALELICADYLSGVNNASR
jgi:hypothetical protein